MSLGDKILDVNENKVETGALLQKANTEKPTEGYVFTDPSKR